MFWIPVSAIIITVWLCIHFVSQVKTEQYNAEFNDYQKSKQALANIVVDSNLEYRLKQEIQTDLEQWKKTMREFMGGGSEWEEYMDYASGERKILMIEMAKRGRLPDECVKYGFNFPLPLNAKRSIGVCSIDPVRGRAMNEQFILRIEEYLRREKNIRAVAWVWKPYFDQDKNMCTRHMPLRQYVSEYGYGTTVDVSKFEYILDK